MTGTAVGHAQLCALAGSEGQKLSVLEAKGAGERKQGLVCCELGMQASPRDDGSAGKSPNGAPSKWGFPCAFEKIENNRLPHPHLHKRCQTGGFEECSPKM